MRVTLGPDYPRWARAAALTFQMIYQQPVRYEYHLVAPPTLLIVGAEDHVVPLGQYAKPEDAARLGVADGDIVRLGNKRGDTRIHVRLFEGLRRGVLISEGVWPSDAFLDGRGVNVLTGDDVVAPFGGAAFHDNRVWVRAA